MWELNISEVLTSEEGSIHLPLTLVANPGRYEVQVVAVTADQVT